MEDWPHIASHTHSTTGLLVQGICQPCHGNSLRLSILVCKIVEGQATIEELEEDVENPGCDDYMGDTEHFKVAPNQILVTHNCELLISFTYTKNPPTLDSMITRTPIKKVDRMFPTDDKDVFIGFGGDGCNYDNRDYAFFFYNIQTNNVVDYFDADGGSLSEVGFSIVDYYCWESIQDLNDKNTFKVFSAEYVLEVNLYNLERAYGYTIDIRKKHEKLKYGFTMFDKEYEKDLETDSSKESDDKILNKLPCHYGDNMKHLCSENTLQINESDYLFWDNKTNFFHFNNKTDEYSVLKKGLFTEMKFCIINEVYRDEEDISYIVKGHKCPNKYLIINRHNIE